MKTLLQKSLRGVARLTLSLAAFLILALIVVQLTLIIGVNLLNTGKARDFIQAQVNTAMEPSGYSVTFDRLFYDGTRGLSLYGVAVADKGGPILALDRVSLSVMLSKIMLRDLDVTLDAGTLDLLRLPDSKESGTAGSAEFVIPDLYFNALTINRIAIQHLNINASVAGGDGLSLSPKLQARATLNDKIEFSATLDTGIAAEPYPVSLPATLKLNGDFDPASSVLVLKQAHINSVDYKIEGQGAAAFAPGGTLDLNINISYPDLKKLTQDYLASTEAILRVTGSHDHPALDLTGNLKPALLAERGLGDIEYTLKAEDIIKSMRATTGIVTNYREKPVMLESILSYKDADVIIESIKATAPDLALNGDGRVNTATMLADARIKIGASNLSSYADLLALNIGGALKADITLKPENENQSASVDATLSNGRYDDITITALDAGASWPNIATPWPQDGRAAVKGLRLAPDTEFSSINTSLKLKADNIYALRIDGAGNVVAPLRFNGGADVGDLTAALPSLRDIDFTLSLGQSDVRLKGALNADGIDLVADTRDFRLSDLPMDVPQGFDAASLSGDVKMTGALTAPQTTASLSLAGLDAERYRDVKLTAQTQHDGAVANVTLSGTGTGIRALDGRVSVPVQLALRPFAFALDPQAKIAGDVSGDVDLKPLATLFLPPTQTFSGDVKTNGTISGTISAPDIAGAITLKNGNFLDEQNGIELAAMDMSAQFTRTDVLIASLSATDGESGTVQGRGRVAFGATQSTDLSVDIKQFHLPKTDMANGVLNAALTLRDRQGGYAAGGTIDIAEMNIVIPETFQSKIPSLNIVDRRAANAPSASPAQSILLDVKVNAPNQVFVRGWGLDAEFGGAVDITGTADAPQFNGALSSKRGRYEEFGKRFTLEKADLRFQGTIPPSPYLDIKATVPASDVVAAILLTGPVAGPKIEFSSTPALPSDEVLSRILFGRNMDRITPFQAVQLAQTIQRFSGQGGGGFDPMATLRSVTGLDDITVEMDESGQANVGVGKYLTDKVYLEFEKGSGENSGAANIQVEITPSINVQSKIGQDAQTGGGVFWKRDY